MYCPKCSQYNSEDHQYCSKCGQVLNQNPNDLETCTKSEKYCSHCGSRIINSEAFCPKCGHQVNSSSHSEDNDSFGIYLISLLIPLVGFIMYLVFHHNYPIKAKAAGISSIIGFFVWLLSPLIIYLLSRLLISIFF